MSVDTRHSSPRRMLKFGSLEEIQLEVERLAAGPIEASGNWSPGQIFLHLARMMDMSIDGHKPAPWILRFLGRHFFKKSLLKGPMLPGLQLPKLFEDLIPGATTTEAGVRSIQAAIRRLEQTAERQPHPALGPLTREQWDQFHCRHAELHLSFLRSGEAAS